MKKFSILLALLMLVVLLTACNSEADNSPADFTVPGYLIGIPTGSGWTSVEDTLYDLELTKDSIKMYVRAFSLSDFVDMPTAEELYIDELAGLLSTLTDTSEKEAQSTYTAGGKSIIVSMQRGKEGDTVKEFYCFTVDFGGNTGTVAWVAFSAEPNVMSKNKSTFKSIVDGMTCTAEFAPDYDPFADELQFDEDGNLIVEETESIDYSEDTEPASEPTATPSEPPMPTETSEVPVETTEASEPAATTEATKAN